MRERPPIGRPPKSREFTDRALAQLRADRYSPSGWARFFAICGVRSYDQIRSHPRPAVEVTVLHLALVPIAWRRPVVLAGSWFLAITHLGLLGAGRDSIGAANCLSLLRANLPLTRTAPILAMFTDVVDGRLARRGVPTAFGGYADGLADVTFWTRYAARRSGRLLGALAVAGWLLPATAITVAYFARGGVIDYARPEWSRRLSAVLQCSIAAAALLAVPERGGLYGKHGPGRQEGRRLRLL